MTSTGTSRTREAVLWAGAIAGLLSMVAAVAVTFFGFSFLIFRSGSMGPDIPTGSLALARTVPAAELRSGDVVSVIAFNGERITHRVVQSTVRVTDEGDIASLILKGDANGTPDQEIYQVAEAERQIASLPYVGYVATVLLSPPGLIAGGCLAAMLLLLGFGGQTPGSPTHRGGSHRAGGTSPPRRATTTGVAASLTLLAVAGTGVSATSATFTDQATLTSGSLTAGTLSPPPNIRCVNNGTNDFITWDVPAGASPTGYRVFYDANGNGPNGSEDVGPDDLVYRPPAAFINNRRFTVTVAALAGNWVSGVVGSADIRVRSFAIGSTIRAECRPTPAS